MFSINATEITFAPTGDLKIYLFQSTIKTMQVVSEKVVVAVYLVVLLLSIILTFWKNKHINQLLAYMNAAYSDGQFQSNQIYFRQNLITCFRFNERFSYIPTPNRLLFLIIAIHVQVLILIAFQTLFIRTNESVENCTTFENPYQVLQCENNLDPCRLNNTENIPKCTYYYFAMNNVITTVTSIITWHYALRYFVLKLVRFGRWILFRNDDQVRSLCCCYRATPRVLQCIMYFYYIILWIYLSSVVLADFIWNTSLFNLSENILGPNWGPVFMAGGLLSSLSLALVPELLQNWLDATDNGQVLLNFQSKGLLLVNVEQLIHLISK